MDEQCVFSNFLNSLALGEQQFYKKKYSFLPIMHSSFTRVAPIQNENNSSSFRMELCPGDTVRQCRALYSRDRTKDIIVIEQEGWKVATNLHLSSSYKNIIWFNSQPKWQSYFSYWYKEYNTGNIRQYKRTEWATLIAKLEQSGNISNIEKKEFDQEITPKSYSRVNLCASLRIWFDIGWNDFYDNPSEIIVHTKRMIKNVEKALS